VSRSDGWAVGNAGLKAFGMDHGNPDVADGTVLFCSDEHVTFTPPRPVGELAWLAPAHIDPTMALHERVYLFSGDAVVDVWPIDLRGW
jgi:D-threonine aldolase